MPTTFPSALDLLTNPLPTQFLSAPSHSGQHSNANDAIEAIEALLVGPAFRNVKGAGAIGNGLADDTAALQAAFASPGRWYVPDGDYSINATLTLASESVVVFNSGARIFFAAGTVGGIAILTLTNLTDVTVVGGLLDGNDTINPTPAGGLFGVRIAGGDRIRFYGTRCIDFADQSVSGGVGGDGFYITSGAAVPDDIQLIDCIADGCGRDGFTVICGTRVDIVRPRALNTGGNNPGAGINVQPNAATDTVFGVRVIDPYTRDNYRGVNVTLAALTTASERVDIEVNNLVSYSEDHSGIIVGAFVSTAHVAGTVRFTKPSIYFATRTGILVTGYENTGPHLLFDTPYIDSCGQGTGATLDSGFTLSATTGAAGTTPLGNVDFINPYVVDNRSTVLTWQAFFIRDLRNVPAGVNRTNVINPQTRNLQRTLGGLADTSAGTGLNLVQDDYGNLNRDVDVSESMSGASMAWTYTNSAYTTFRTQELPDNGVGLVTFTQTSTAHAIRVKPSTGFQIVPTTTVVDKYIASGGSSGGLGASVTLQRTGTRWFVTNMVGTWTPEP